MNASVLLMFVLNRAEFYQDARTVACLKHANIVGLVGVCSDDEPLYAVLEYMKHGDLWQFLQARVAAESSLGRSLSAASHRKTLRCPPLCFASSHTYQLAFLPSMQATCRRIHGEEIVVCRSRETPCKIFIQFRYKKNVDSLYSQSHRPI